LGQTALQNLAAVLKDMIQAEFAQQKDLFNCAIDEKSYLRRTLKKSGSFLACCCKLGALLAGAPAKTVFALEKFGLHAGISFQITVKSITIREKRMINISTCFALVMALLVGLGF